MVSSTDLDDIPSRIGVLFIVNQDVALETIADRARDAASGDGVLIVTSQAFFPEEADRLRALCAPVPMRWLPMSHLLADAEMEACDDEAVATLAPEGGRVDAADFMQLSRRLRNARGARNLARRASWDACFAADGLGVVRDAWPDAQPIPQRQPEADGTSRFATIIRHVRWATRIERVESADGTYIFFGSTSRLRFREGLRKAFIRIPWPIAILRGGGRGLTKRLLSGALAVASRGDKVQVATTVHHFHPEMLAAFPELRVFADGLHPPNYPVSYGASFRGARIVAREECDRIWFEKCGCEVLPPTSFLAPELSYGDPSRPRAIHTICLMLNHAGDWTALVDRSDTDLAVMAFAEAAEAAPELAFRIRAHPTMATAYHEGIDSLKRLREWVERRGLANLAVSSGDLVEDMAWTDLCVSEYSNVLVDAMKAGKACVALNPTNRRNLLAHLVPYGLREVHDSAQLLEFLRAINTASLPIGARTI